MRLGWWRHRVRVRVSRVAQASCSCGWQALPHYSLRTARRDATEHREATR